MTRDEAQPIPMPLRERVLALVEERDAATEQVKATQDMLTDALNQRDACAAERDAARAEVERVIASFLGGEHDCDTCGRVTNNPPRCTECRHGKSPLLLARAQVERLKLDAVNANATLNASEALMATMEWRHSDVCARYATDLRAAEKRAESALAQVAALREMLPELDRLERFSHEMRDQDHPRLGLGDGERASLSHARLIADALANTQQAAEAFVARLREEALKPLFKIHEADGTPCHFEQAGGASCVNDAHHRPPTYDDWMRARAAAIDERVAMLYAALDRDRTGLAAALNAIKSHVKAHGWVLEGRGSYEWDDERYRDEAGNAMRPVIEIAEKALNASGKVAAVALNDIAPAVFAWLRSRDLAVHAKWSENLHKSLRGEPSETNTGDLAEIEEHDAKVRAAALREAAAHFRAVPHHVPPGHFDDTGHVPFGHVAADVLDSLAAVPTSGERIVERIVDTGDGPHVTQVGVELMPRPTRRRRR